MSIKDRVVPRSRWVRLLLAVAASLVLLIETPLAYMVMPYRTSVTVMEFLARNSGSEARLVWLLERQGFDVSLRGIQIQPSICSSCTTRIAAGDLVKFWPIWNVRIPA